MRNVACRSLLGRLLAVVVLGLLLGVPGASAAPPEEQQGARVLGDLESGKLSCDRASAEEFDQVGEYVMGRMLGSKSGHEAMDRMMSSMMGGDSEQQMHEAMGRRFSGCGGGRLPRGFGHMLGTMNAIGTMGGGTMGGIQGGPASMMGGYARGASAEDDDDDGPSAGAMVGMMAVLIGAVALALLWLRPRGHPRGRPMDVLKRRFAEGDLTEAEYRDRKQLLEGR